MNNCEDKIKYSCPPNSPFAKCVKTELTPPSFSGLTGNCHDVQEIEENLYTLIGGIKTEIDLTAITTTCLTLPTVKNVKTLIQYLVNRDCAQQLQINDLIARVVILEAKVLVLQANTCP
mgnify:CR=1 FL=1